MNDEKLRTTINHPALKKSVSYQRLIRLECYRLVKHLVGDKAYEGFKAWWIWDFVPTGNFKLAK
jgi:CRISPR-associated protein Cas1